MLLREGDADVRVRYDRHTTGLFPRATWSDLVRGVGFDVSVVTDPWDRDLFIGRRPR
jgi:hypothetical protein